MMYWIRTHRALRRAKKALAPSPAFRATLWKTLEREGGLAPLPFWRAHPALGFAVPALCLTLFFAGTSAYAYGSPEVTPEHPLYTVRRGVEYMEKTFAVTDGARVAAQMRRIAHRIAEAEKVVTKDGGFDRVFRDMDREFSGTLEVAPAGVRRARILKKMEASDDAALSQLQTLAAEHPARALPKVQMLIVNDTERIQARLSNAKDEETRAFFARRLKRREQALSGILMRFEGGPATSSLPVRNIDRTLELFRQELRDIKTEPGE